VIFIWNDDDQFLLTKEEIMEATLEAYQAKYWKKKLALPKKKKQFR